MADYREYQEYLSHHGILGQKWGERNGPPYPLKGGSYSADEKKKIRKARLGKNSIYTKRHFDKVIEKGEKLNTLSYDKDRTKDKDMFFAAYESRDKNQYKAMFNKALPQTIYDDDGTELGTGTFFKYQITNEAASNIKVASEDTGANIFKKLYTEKRDFYNFVKDPERMETAFDKTKYRFKGYRDAKRALNKLRDGKELKEKDVQHLYRMFNYVIPSDGRGNARLAKDVATQRARLFKELKENGYGAVLDVNDAMYGGFKAHAPVIVIDMEQIIPSDIKRLTRKDKAYSQLAYVGQKLIGI